MSFLLSDQISLTEDFKRRAERGLLLLQTRRSPLVGTKPVQVRLSTRQSVSHGLLTVWHAGPDHQRIAKLDRENEVAPPPKVNASVGKVGTVLTRRSSRERLHSMQAIQTARMEKQLTQKDLAQKTNEKPSVIQDYESGKAIPNAQVLSKFERILGVKLRGEYRRPISSIIRK
jgi:putative transcription factor